MSVELAESRCRGRAHRGRAARGDPDRRVRAGRRACGRRTSPTGTAPAGSRCVRRCGCSRRRASLTLVANTGAWVSTAQPRRVRGDVPESGNGSSPCCCSYNIPLADARRASTDLERTGADAMESSADRGDSSSRWIASSTSPVTPPPRPPCSASTVLRPLESHAALPPGVHPAVPLGGGPQRPPRAPPAGLRHPAQATWMKPNAVLAGHIRRTRLELARHPDDLRIKESTHGHRHHQSRHRRDREGPSRRTTAAEVERRIARGRTPPCETLKGTTFAQRADMDEQGLRRPASRPTSNEVAELMVREMGKPIAGARAEATQVRASGMRFYAEARRGVPRRRAPRRPVQSSNASRAVRPLPAARCRARGDAVELPALAGRPLRRPRPDGRQHRRAEARLERAAARRCTSTSLYTRAGFPEGVVRRHC